MRYAVFSTPPSSGSLGSEGTRDLRSGIAILDPLVRCHFSILPRFAFLRATSSIRYPRVIALFIVASVLSALDVPKIRMDRVDAVAQPGTDAPASASGPRVVLRDRTVDLGPMQFDQPVVYSFVYRNGGTSDLKIAWDQSTCACIGHSLTDTLVHPGDSGRIVLRPETGKDDPGRGKKSVTVVLETNDPNNRQLILTLHYILADQVDAVPAEVDLGLAGSAEVLEQALTIYRLKGDGKIPRILSVSSSSPRLSISKISEETIPQGAASTYKVELQTSDLFEPFDSTLRFETDSRRVPLLEVPVRASVRSPIVTEPEVVVFGLTTTGVRVSRMVKIRLREGARTAPAAVTSTDPRLKPHLEKSRDNVGWTLKVDFSPGPSEGRLKEELVLTDESGSVIAKVPVYAIVRSSNK